MSTISNQCRIQSCSNPVETKKHQLCNAHSIRLWRHGDPEGGRPVMLENHAGVDKSAYKVWVDMKQRCQNPNHESYGRYGGRGITVCAAWTNSYNTFIRDVGPRPSGYQLDRRDGSLGYSPENCHWVSKSKQQANTARSTRPDSGYRGVEVKRNKFQVRMWTDWPNRARLTVGTFDDASEAAWMRDQFALGIWGDSAILNFEYL